MAKAADIGGKRLIGLNPDAWVQWVTQRRDVVAQEIVASEFQWISRETDALVRAHSPALGDFLVLTELQMHYEERMPRRMRAYAALAEEKYNLPVYPVLVNIIQPSPDTEIAAGYDSEFLGLRARQDYRVINLWTIEAELVFQQQLSTLLPFVPVLKGGDRVPVMQRAVHELRANEPLSELEPLLAFFARYVLDLELVQQIMRWDMTVLRQSPWYQEILQEGKQLGIELGRQEGAQGQLLRLLELRFETVTPEVRARVRQLNLQQLDALTGVALQANSLDQFAQHLPPAQAPAAWQTFTAGHR